MLSHALAAALALVSAALFVVPDNAAAETSAWSQGDESRLRLIAAPLKDGTLGAAIEIELTGGWHTYWRTPGDAGIPPQFDFSASENLASVQVLYPAPERYDDGTSVSNVYHDGVVLPLNLSPTDATKPMTLRLSAFYGVCREVCIPAEGSAELTVPEEPQADARARIAIAAALARVPRPSPGEDLAIGPVKLSGETAEFTVTAEGAGRAPVVFAEGPESWFLPQPEMVSGEDGTFLYRLPLEGRPKGASLSGAALTLTAVLGGHAVELHSDLP
ncbi:protein-disulfide reductase DsbD domain-containing protein [Afifella sp. IM 167]|uniref:protein-disulfide reductase DsbD domain-containing protein n=1 Tax=Afifella sp. IM 167 TaxID=2033586 RepID=UPI001CCD94BD|nr:protein-disulfide reductase DsbD domain-containing protein [Afifella sp. IM 167]